MNSTSLLFIMSLKREIYLTELSKSPAEVAKSNKQWVGTLTKLYQNYPNKIMDFFRKRSIVTIADDYTEKAEQVNDS